MDPVTHLPESGIVNTALLILRLVVGPVMAAHGAQKLFGWFGGYGIAGTGGFFHTLGFRPGHVFATVAGLAEFLSGLLILLGFLGPIGPALMVSVMIVAAGSVHWKNGLFAATNGIELPLLYSAIGITVALTGHGAYSLDAATGLDSLWNPRIAWIVLLVGIVGGFANLALRRPDAPPTPV